jgi:hypothetical protein
MDAAFLRDLDTLRMRCGFPIRVNDDARTQAEHDSLYTGDSHKPDSAHLYKEGIPVRSVDIEPTPVRLNDGCALTTEQRELTLTYEILRMWKEGRWPHLGLGCETGHWHIDDTPRLSTKRPAFWVDVSK